MELKDAKGFSKDPFGWSEGVSEPLPGDRFASEATMWR